MTRPLRIQYPGGHYYISQHSNSGTSIFRCEADYETFLDILASARETYSVTLHGFVLLKDHFHLLAETEIPNISEFMRNLNIRYTSYFNKAHKRKGHLYGGRFKSVIFERDLYLGKLSHYLHLNPVNKGAIKKKRKEEKRQYLARWKWSSLPGFMGAYPRYSFINHHMVLHPFGGDTPQGRRNYTASLHQSMENGFALRSETVGQAILGSLGFVKEMRKQLSPDLSDREQPELRKIDHYIIQERILAELERVLRCSRQELLLLPGDLRSMTMDVLYRYGGLTNPEIGDLMGLDYSSVSIGRKRLQTRRGTDLMLDARMTLLEKRLERMRKENSVTPQ